MLLDALAWAARGFVVFPLMPRTKIPLGALVPHGFKDATRDPETIRNWWREYRAANIGVATGSGFFVLDLDGPDAEAWFLNSCGLHGEAPDTLTVKTSRGLHLFFRTDAVIPCSTSYHAQRVDVKGDGGYVVAAPSIHPDGSIYTIVKDKVIAEAPRWLVDLAMPDEKPKAPELPAIPFDGNRKLRAIPGILSLVANAREGERNKIAFWASRKWLMMD